MSYSVRFRRKGCLLLRNEASFPSFYSPCSLFSSDSATEETRSSSNDNNSSDIDEVVPLVRNEGRAAERIQNLIRDARKLKKHDIIIQAYRRCLLQGIELHPQELLTVLDSLISQIKDPHMDVEMVLGVYKKLASKKIFNFQLFSNMLTFCQYQHNFRLALEVNANYESSFKHNEASLALLLSALTDMNAINQVKNFYNYYRDQAQGSNSSEDRIWRPLDPVVHLDIVIMLCDQDRRSVAAQILKDFAEDNDRYLELVEAGIDKKDDVEKDSISSAPFVTKTLLSREGIIGPKLLRLLEDCLLYCDKEMTEILLKWLVEAFVYREQLDSTTISPLYLSKGLLLRCFQVGSILGSQEITDLAKDLCTLSRVSLGREEYVHIFVAACRRGDMEAAIETLVVTEASNIELCPNDSKLGSELRAAPAVSGAQRYVVRSSNVHAWGSRYFEYLISKMLSNAEDANRLQFVLAELAESDVKPPVAAINALIMLYAHVLLLDNAFRVMHDFNEVYHQMPNANTHYHLLSAIAKSRSPRIDNMLRILSNMESQGCSPDSGCFSLLLETMLKSDEPEGLNSVLDHIIDSSKIATRDDGTPVFDTSKWPSLRSLRRLAIYFKINNSDEKRIEDIISLIQDKSGSKFLPIFFKQRLDGLDKKRNRK